MSSPFDTIVAPITGTQPAAVAVVRISGPEAWQVASDVFFAWPEMPESHKAVYGKYSTGDDGLVLPFAAGHSYTGEESVEMSCHGSPASVAGLIEACVRAGARLAGPGEFTQRAFLNGRLDLTEAEAVADTVNALTGAQLRLANLQREGVLHREVSSLRSGVFKVLAAVEASVDFEEEIGPLDRAAALQILEGLATRIEKLLETAEIGHLMRKGLRIAIIGPPNAGKSSLFNAIVGRERAIVTPTAGTTRDYLEEQLDFGGVPVVLIDTAGLRETEDAVESIGVQRSRAQAAGADVVWFVLDVCDPPRLEEIPAEAWILCNKVDLGRPADYGSGRSVFEVSAKTGVGVADLVRHVARFAEQAKALELPPVSDRHVPLLNDALVALTEAGRTLCAELPDDLLCTHLRSAASLLGEITGETASEDMIERIFADFCIGK